MVWWRDGKPADPPRRADGNGMTGTVRRARSAAHQREQRPRRVGATRWVALAKEPLPPRTVIQYAVASTPATYRLGVSAPGGAANTARRALSR